MPACEEPVKEFAEAEDADSSADQEDGKNCSRLPEQGRVCSCRAPECADIAHARGDGTHYILVLPEDQ